jgi:SPP1 family predicted phage head-tail adaptor
MSLDPGRLRHRVTIQRPVSVQNATTGKLSTSWANVAVNIAAAIEPLSVREFVAAHAMQSEITTRIVIRYRAGLTAEMRIVHGSKLYNPHGWLADPDSGLEYLTAPCSEGVNDGQ